MNKQTINNDTRLVRTSKLPSAELGPNDTVLLDAEQGVYYGLEGPARNIWDCLGNETSFADICLDLAKKYDVEPSQCERDTRVFIQQLLENGLVKIR